MPLLPYESATVVDFVAYKAARRPERPSTKSDWPSWLKPRTPTTRAIAHRQRMLSYLTGTTR